jgi:hypothetical protein
MLKQQCALRHVANLEYVILIPSKLVFSLTPQRRSNECQFLLNSLCFDPTGARTHDLHPQALVSFKTYMSPPLPYFKVNIYPFPLPHFASIYFDYLWSFRWPNYIVTLPRYFSFRLPHLNIPTGPPQTNWTRIISDRGLVKISTWQENQEEILQNKFKEIFFHQQNR